MLSVSYLLLNKSQIYQQNPKIELVLMSRVLLDWIAQSGLQSNLVDWIVIDNPKSKLDFGFGLSN